MLTPQEQAQNAVKWIDALPTYKQAPTGDRGKPGDKDMGFCCLGAGCHVLKIPYHVLGRASQDFSDKVGLISRFGTFSHESPYIEGHDSLSSINDLTYIGFKRIAELMKRHPEWMFEDEVAVLIMEHYQNVQFASTRFSFHCGNYRKRHHTIRTKLLGCTYEKFNKNISCSFHPVVFGLNSHQAI